MQVLRPDHHYGKDVGNRTDSADNDRLCAVSARSPYLSDYSAIRQQENRYRNRLWMESAEAVNSHGVVINLAAASDSSTSNPRIRRTEMMVRLRGEETIAQQTNEAGLFLTITCPSRFHATRGRGEPNPKYRDATPRDAQRYLCQLWARARSALHRESIPIHGIRVAEPHQDGCPHWHLLLWCSAEKVDRVKEIIHGHALADSPTEAGASRYRFKCVDIDHTKGSAVGYIAKYIAKNVDGALIEAAHARDADGQTTETPPQESAMRIQGWASTWGIRQLQFFGTAPVSKWREVRRLRQKVESEDIEAARTCADQGNWAEFSAIAPSLTCFRDLGSRSEPDEIQTLRLVGLIDRTGELVVTRPDTWVVRAASDSSTPWTSGNNYTSTSVKT